MGIQDIRHLLLALIPVVVLVTLAAMLPIYRMPDGTYERHWVWNPPHMPVGNGFDRLTKEQIERLSADPAQKAILDSMQSMPRSIPIRPVFIGPRHSEGRNFLGWLALSSVILYGIFVIHKWVNR